MFLTRHSTLYFNEDKHDRPMTFRETLNNYMTRVFCRNLTRILTVHGLLHVYLYASTTVSGHLGQRRNKWKQNNERENILIEKECS